MEQNKFDVFISYSRKDYLDDKKNAIPGNVVSIVKDALTKAGISYWFDKEGLSYGNDFTDRIVSNIEASYILIYLATVNSNASPWTSREIACADELGKVIIPVRIDHTPYNRKILFRIADRSYIDYYANPEKGLNELVESIKRHLEIIHAEKKRKEEEEAIVRETARKKAEEERKRKEQEERRFAEEQELIVSDIKLACTKLNNEEIKIQLDRKNLILTTEKIADKKRREDMSKFILESSPIRMEMFENVKKCKDKIEELTKELGNATVEITNKENERQTLQNEFDILNNQINKKTHDSINRQNYWLHGIYVCIILVLFILLCTHSCSSNNSPQKLLSHNPQQTYEESKEQATQTTKEDLGINELFEKGKEYYDTYYNTVAGQRDDENLRKAFNLWRQAADKGMSEAQDSVGMCFYKGRGTGIDYGEAVNYFKLAAAQGCVDAQYRLGLCYYNGCISGNAKTLVSISKALEYFESAAAQGNTGALCYAGICYYKYKEEYGKSYDLFENAAKTGSRTALYYLGLHYHTGHFKKQDRVQAFDYFKQAAERGEPDAQYYVGIYYHRGLGNVPKNKDEAIKWFKKAAKGGNNLAKKALQENYNIIV